MVIIWPFPTRDQLIVALHWLTDILPTVSAEQRFALRAAPRREFNFRHTLSYSAYRSARDIVRQADSYLLPDWTVPAYPGALMPGSAVSVDFEETDLNFIEGDQALLWDSIDNYEQIEVLEVTTTGIVASFSQEFLNPRLMPLKSADLIGGLESSRTPAQYLNINLSFLVVDGRDLGYSDLNQYLTEDVLSECPIISSQNFSEPIEWPLQAVDNKIGKPAFIRQRSFPAANFVMRWHKFNRSDISNLIYWLHSRRGRWKAFWLPTFGKDFNLLSNISASDTQIIVSPLPGLEIINETNFHIEIRSVSDLSFYREIINVTTTLLGNLSLEIATSLGTGFSVSEISRISVLRHVRFDADRIELNYRARGGVSVAVNCLEVPV